MAKRTTRQAPEIEVPKSVPEVTLEPNVPSEGEVLELTIKIPLASTPGDPSNYDDVLTFSRGVDVKRMSKPQIDVVSRLRRGLRLLNYEEGESPVDSNPAAIRWLLQHIHTSISNPG